MHTRDQNSTFVVMRFVLLGTRDDLSQFSDYLSVPSQDHSETVLCGRKQKCCGLVDSRSGPKCLCGASCRQFCREFAEQKHLLNPSTRPLDNFSELILLLFHSLTLLSWSGVQWETRFIQQHNRNLCRQPCPSRPKPSKTPKVALNAGVLQWNTGRSRAKL